MTMYECKQSNWEKWRIINEEQMHDIVSQARTLTTKPLFDALEKGGRVTFRKSFKSANRYGEYTGFVTVEIRRRALDHTPTLIAMKNYLRSLEGRLTWDQDAIDEYEEILSLVEVALED